MLQCCVCLSSVCNVCIVTKRAGAKVTIPSLEEVIHEKSIATKMNDLDLCLEVVITSCLPLRHIRRCNEYLGNR